MASGKYLKPTKLVKAFNQVFPVYEDEDGTVGADIQELAQARKKAEDLLLKCKLHADHPVKGPAARWNYLSSLAVLRKGMLEANGRRRLRSRLSMRQILDQSLKYKVCQELNEPVHVYMVPKSSGVGWRLIQDFGPVARGAQRMVVHLLKMIYTPADFQFTTSGVEKAIRRALKLITEEGYIYAAELDIRSHYPSFQTEALIKDLPLPKTAIRQIVVGASATWETHSHLHSSLTHLMQTTPHGIPQGSAASSVVAEWSISQLKWIEDQECALINYADNFFLFAKDAEKLKLALEVLRSAIAELPGGVFTTKPDQGAPGVIKNVSGGFQMLGCIIVLNGDAPIVEPTDAAHEELMGRFRLDQKIIDAWLMTAEKEKDSVARLEGVQAFLRLWSFARSWVAAHAVCTDIEMIEEDLNYSLAQLMLNYSIDEAELTDAADASTNDFYYASSKSSVASA